MDLKKYPFDVQECRLEIESFSHSDDELLYFCKEANKTVTIQEHIDIPHFSLLGHKLTERTAETTTGTYKRVLITMYMKRDPQGYMHKYGAEFFLFLFFLPVQFPDIFFFL